MSASTQVSGGRRARARRTTRSLAGAARAQSATLAHAVRREPITTPPLRMATVGWDDIGIARRAMRDPEAPEFHGAPALLERIFATWIGARHAAAFASGRVALSACLSALDLRPGDAVVVPAYTCLVVVNAVRFAGLRPVYADIELDTYGAEAAAVEAALDVGARAVVVQHLYGMVSRDVLRIVDLARARGVPVVEDCAQAMGARLDGRAAGTLGDAGLFSCGAGKPIEAGLGGIAVTSDDAIARGLRRFQEAATDIDGHEVSDVMATYVLDHARLAAPGRWWRGPIADVRLGGRRVPGATEDELRGSEPPAYPRRMPAAVARLSLNQLAKLESFARRRRRVAAAWSAACAGSGQLPRPLEGSLSAWTAYPVLVPPAMKEGRRWAYERYGVSLSTWFSTPPEPAAIAGNPCAERAYEGCVGFPTSGTGSRRGC